VILFIFALIGAGHVWSSPEHTPPILTVRLECSGPLPLHNFRANLMRGHSDRSVNWDHLGVLPMHPTIRLQFEKYLTPEFPTARLILEEKGEEQSVWLKAMTLGHEHLVVIHSEDADEDPPELTPFQRHLLRLNQDYQLFRLEELQNVNMPLLYIGFYVPGTLVFSQENFAVIFGKDFSIYSVCRPTLEALWNTRELAKKVFSFLTDPLVSNLLKCDDFLQRQ
jgi:hypothetical protein